ncbi:RND transporter [Rhodoferax koreense]|uniref:RND transporter n=1 Tax=Rhodoferax koreensis TaxID=1842727 RepID=A0A1P8K2C1_9BURK|nr:efflux transporter outer membrane subunit [Rhodoferax koreense]APW40162.1 RND transporter [Rhodoferax koreense]
MKTNRSIPIAALALLLAACATPARPPAVALPSPTQWQAPLPHQGSVEGLNRWWQQLDDPLLAELIDAAQAVSPTLASARSRVLQARATRTTANAALLPSVDASANASRGFNESAGGLAGTAQGALQASWEADLFGANRATRDAAQARADGAEAGWHDARVSVTAEVANAYFSLRSCNRQLAVTQSDAGSRAETSRLTGLAADAGFQAPATAALARASSAEASARVTQQRALCDVDVKALVALTGLDEPVLRRRLVEVSEPAMPPALFTITSLPAGLLAQRPDVFTAEREVAAASAEVDNAQAQRYPKLSLTGSIGTAYLRMNGVGTSFNTWSIGPVALSLPIFDGGRRAAGEAAAEARYDEAAALYRAKARQAVREVEEALVNLDSAARRFADANAAVEGYRVSFNATQARYQGGLASLVELEDARRQQLASQTALLSLERERWLAWVALYRAAGGGWSVASAQP